MDYSSGQTTNTSIDKDMLYFYTQTLTYQLGKLKHVIDQRNQSTYVEAFNSLAEISKTMRLILEHFPFLNKSKELLINANNLVRAVKLYDYDNYSLERHSKLVDNINTFYRSFQNNISNVLVPEAASMSSSVQSIDSNSTIQSTTTSMTNNSRIYQSVKVQSKTNLPEERIFAHEYGLDELLKQAKAWSKYMKEIVTFIEKRSQIENEYNRSIIKNAQNLKTSIDHLKSDKAFLPFNNIYNQFCKNEIKNASICDENFVLLTKNILNPINEFRIEIDKQIKKIKDDWNKENKQYGETVNNYSKSRENYLFELQKTKAKSENHDWANEKLDSVFEADTNCTKYLLNLNSQTELFKKAKRDAINRLQNLLTNIEVKIKEITSHYFETLKDSITYSPEEIQKAITDTKCYEIGKCYRDFANSLPIFQESSLPNHLISRVQDLQEIDSSESDNNSTFLIKQRKAQILNNANVKLANPEFPIKSIGKKYKSYYGKPTNYKITKDIRQPFSLVTLCKSSSNSVPDIVKQVIRQIELRGLHINGIYRVSAVKSQLDNLCNNYENNPNSIDLSEINPHVLANFLKAFFRELPEPLLTFPLYSQFIALATKYPKNCSLDSHSEAEIIDHLKKLVQRLPLVNYNTLKYLICHLKKISNNHSVNQMDPQNLGIVFGPNLFRRGDNDDRTLLHDVNHQGRVIELFIMFADEIFDLSQENENYITRTNSFGSMDKLKNQSEDIQMSATANNENHTNHQRILYKSATCSSLQPDVSQIRHDISQARLNFFAPNVNTSTNRYYSSYSQPNDVMSPFSQITAASSPANFIHNNRMKRTPSVGHNLMSSSEKPSTSRIYNKHNELSRSSSDIYSHKNMNISITPNSEEHV